MARSMTKRSNPTPLGIALRWLRYGNPPLWSGEGGYVNRKSDRGGPTNHGITGKALAQAIRAGPIAKGTTIKALTWEQADAIYFWDYWSPAQCAGLPPAVAVALFDGCVHSGQGNAVKWLQRALLPACKVDGKIGPQTIALANGASEGLTLVSMQRERVRFLTRLVKADPLQAANLKGWMNRLEALDAVCVELLA